MKLNGSGKWIITTIVAVLIGIAGWYSFAVQHFANQEHALILEQLAENTHTDDQQNAIIISNTTAISDIKTDIASIKTDVAAIKAGLLGRLK